MPVTDETMLTTPEEVVLEPVVIAQVAVGFVVVLPETTDVPVSVTVTVAVDGNPPVDAVSTVNAVESVSVELDIPLSVSFGKT